MKCPNCNTTWVSFTNPSSSSTVVGYCSNCKAGPFVADAVKLLDEKDEDKSEQTDGN